MIPRKKRKVEAEPQTQPMSAFALRKRLLQQRQEAPAPESAAEVAETGATAQVGEADVQAGDDANVSPKVAAEQKPDETPGAQIKSNATGRLASTQQEAPLLRSSFQPNKQNFQRKANGTMLLKLAEEERLVILGSYGVTVKDGEVTLAGATLRASERTHWVHAPRCHALPVLRCSDDATIVLQPHPAAPPLHKLGKLSPVFSRLWNEPRTRASMPDTRDTFQILYTSEDDPARCQDLTAPPEWNKLISELASAKKSGAKAGQPVLFVCGPKSSGKSTFSRLLANRLLTEQAATGGKQPRKRTTPSVAVLDIDPGQPEYGTPGSLSLVHVHEPNLSPPFCHPCVSGVSSNRLLRAHELASVSPAANPEHYVECVTDLYSLYHRDLRNRCPLVVNTPGWIQGTGLEILKELANRIRPSQVVYMSQEGPEDSVQGLKSAYQNVPLVELPSQPSELKSRTAAHLRTMQAMSYFHLDLDGASSSGPPSSTTPNRAYDSWQSTPLTAIRPWMVPYTGPESGILGVMCYDADPPSDLLVDAINGTVVSIVAVENVAAFRTQAEGLDGVGIAMEVDGEEDAMVDGGASASEIGRLPLARSPEGIPHILNPYGTTLDPRHSRKLGVALVRGIDAKNKEIHLLTPLLAEAIDEIIRQDGLGVVLVSGKFDPPTWAYTEDLYLQHANSDGAGDDNEKGEEITDEDTDDDKSEAGEDAATGSAYALASGAHENGQPSSSEIPWVEILQGDQKRAVGSRVWRVRRDLGRNKAGAVAAAAAATS